MVELVPMTEAEFQKFRQHSIQEYAQDNVKDGRWSEEEALRELEQEFQRFLPQGRETPGHYLSMLVDKKLGQSVGVLWFNVQERAGQQQAFVYDVEVFEEFRRHGYATQAFQRLEEQAKELGAASIALEVFEHNLAGRAMYEKLGYVTTNDILLKKL